ncbi:MAG: hypothetical protein P8J87_05005, partial [Verrucomicrobiales bacterium]|nr:hypothetical protein [Verrucomicrobiales bacterium]
MIRYTISTLVLSLSLAATSLAAPGDRPFKKQVRTINKAVVAIVDSRSDEVLTHATTVDTRTVVTKASEIGDVPREHLSIRANTPLKIAANWTDEKNDLAVLSIDGKLPAPADLSFTGKLLQGKILTTV